jgi:hypothetical protein
MALIRALDVGFLISIAVLILANPMQRETRRLARGLQ